MNWDAPAWLPKPGSPVQNAWHWLTEWKRRLVRPRDSRRLRVLETVAVGDRRFVFLLQVDQQDYLLASSTAGVTLLAQVAAIPPAAVTASLHAADPSEHLKQTLSSATASMHDAPAARSAEQGNSFAYHMKTQDSAARIGNVCAIASPAAIEKAASVARGTAKSLHFPATAAVGSAPVVERRRKRKSAGSTVAAWLLVSAIVSSATHQSASAQAATASAQNPAAATNAAAASASSANAEGQAAPAPSTQGNTSATRNAAASRLPAPAANPNGANLSINGLGSSSAPWTIVVLLTLLTLIPSLMICVTPFARLLVVFHFLRQALGLQTTPSNQTLIGLSLILTFFIMEPVGKQIYNTGFLPMQAGQITALEAVSRGSEPLRHFMAHYVREKDASLFLEIAHAPRPRSIEDVSMRVLMPAYIVSELKAGFQIGAVLFLPFLVVDIVIASITTSVGMMQLPPVVISTPLKLMLFLMVDGWHLLISSLVRSFY